MLRALTWIGISVTPRPASLPFNPPLQLLFERTAASQEAVLHTLTEEMSRQRVRELFVCYCVLALAGWPMSGASFLPFDGRRVC